MKVIVWTVLGFCALASIPGAGAQSTLAASQYFGAIKTPCRGDDAQAIEGLCDAFIKRLESLAASCTTIDEHCKEGKEVLDALFGQTYRPILADYIVYIEQKQRGEFKLYAPRLMFESKNTPHLYGVRDVYALVFTQHRACLRGTVTTEFRTEPNPFTAILAAVGSSKEPAAAKPPTREPIEFFWQPLSGDPTKPGLWLGFARAGVEQNSSGRITVALQRPKGDQKTEKTTVEKKTVAKDGGTTTETTTTVTITVEKAKTEPADDCSASDDARYSADFIAANAFFSNSPASYAGVSLALGMTLNAGGTSLSSGGSDEAFNGYALAKFYLKRPELRADPGGTGYRRSWALFLGTGIKDAFDEIVTGVSWGHLFGSNVGALAGVNYIKAAEGSNEGRKWRVFAGLEYSF